MNALNHSFRPMTAMVAAGIVMTFSSFVRGENTEVQSAGVPKTIAFRVVLEIPGERDETGPEVRDELELSTLAGTRGQIQLSQQVATPTGFTSVPGGRSSRTVSMQQVGTLIKVQPTIKDNLVLVELQLEKSWVDPTPIATEPTNFVPPTVFSLSLDSTFALQDGKPQTARARVTGSVDGPREVLITLTASIDPEPAARSVASSRQSKPVRPAKKSGAQAESSRRPDRDSSSGVARRSEPPSQSNRQLGLQKMFDLIDRDGDETLSVTEWESHPFARALDKRGFEFTAGMKSDGFEIQMQKTVQNR